MDTAGIRARTALKSDPAADAFPGDIREASALFVDCEDGNATLCIGIVVDSYHASDVSEESSMVTTTVEQTLAGGNVVVR